MPMVVSGSKALISHTMLMSGKTNLLKFMLCLILTMILVSIQVTVAIAGLCTHSNCPHFPVVVMDCPDRGGNERRGGGLVGERELQERELLKLLIELCEPF